MARLSNSVTAPQKGKGTDSSQDDLPVQLSEGKRRPSAGRQIISNVRTPGKTQSSTRNSKTKVSEVLPLPQDPRPSSSRLQRLDSSVGKKKLKEPEQHAIKQETFEEPDELMEDEEERLPVLKSPKKVKRQRVDSDFGEDEVHILGESSVKRRRASTEEREEDEQAVAEMEAPVRPTETLKTVDRRASPVFSPKKDPKSNASSRTAIHDAPSKDSGSKGSVVSYTVLVPRSTVLFQRAP